LRLKKQCWLIFRSFNSLKQLIQKKLGFIVLLKKIKTMLPKIIISAQRKDKISSAFLSGTPGIPAADFLSEEEKSYLSRKMESGTECSVYKHPHLYFFSKTDKNKQVFSQRESARKSGSGFYELLKAEKINAVQILDDPEYPFTLSFIEGFLLSSYSFSKYKKEKDDFIPEEVHVVSHHVTEEQIRELENLVQAVFHTRNLVNEPLSWLTATCFSEEMERLGNEAGFKVEILTRKKIEALRMGGLLAVNKGSIDPPTFTI